MYVKNLKQNLKIKQLSMLLEDSEVIVFIHPTKFLNQLRQTLFYYNRLNFFIVKTSLLRLYFNNFVFFKNLMLSFNGLLFFKSLADFFAFLCISVRDNEVFSLIILYVYWIKKRRFLTLSYCFNLLKEQHFSSIVSFNLDLFLFVLRDILFCYFSIIFMLNLSIFYFFRICRRSDS